MLTKRAGSLPLVGVRVRHDLPDRRHREVVNMANLGKRDELAMGPSSWLESMSIDPVGSRRVATDLEVVTECFVADCTTLGKERQDLLENEGVPLNRS